MEVQGKAEAIEKMIEQLFQARFIQIDNIEAKEIPVQPEGSFSIK